MVKAKKKSARQRKRRLQRAKTKAPCDRRVRIPPVGAFGSLNVSNAAAVALYACRQAERGVG